MKGVAKRFSNFQGVRMPSDFRGGAESGPVKSYRLSEAERAELIARLGPPQSGQRRLVMTGYGATSPPAKGELRERILTLVAKGLDASQIARQAKTSERVVLMTLVHEEVEKNMGGPLSEERQEQIRQLVASGKSGLAIAKELGVGVNTVKKYRESLAPAPTPAEAPTSETLPDLSQRLVSFGERVLMTSRLADDVEKTFGGNGRSIVGAMLAALDADWQELKGA